MFVFQFVIIITILAGSFRSFEYLWYGHTAIIIVYFFQCICKLTGSGEPSDDGEMNEMTLPDSKFELCRSEVEHATRRTQRLPAIFNLYECKGNKHCCFFETGMPELGRNPRSPTLTIAPRPSPYVTEISKIKWPFGLLSATLTLH